MTSDRDDVTPQLRTRGAMTSEIADQPVLETHGGGSRSRRTTREKLIAAVRDDAVITIPVRENRGAAGV